MALIRYTIRYRRAKTLQGNAIVTPGAVRFPTGKLLKTFSNDKLYFHFSKTKLSEFWGRQHPEYQGMNSWKVTQIFAVF